MHLVSKGRFKAIVCTPKVTHAATLQVSSCSRTLVSSRVTKLPSRFLEWTFWRCSRFIENPNQFVLLRNLPISAPLPFAHVSVPFLRFLISSSDFPGNATGFSEHASACFSMAARIHLALLLPDLTNSDRAFWQYSCPVATGSKQANASSWLGFFWAWTRVRCSCGDACLPSREVEKVGSDIELSSTLSSMLVEVGKF